MRPDRLVSADVWLVMRGDRQYGRGRPVVVEQVGSLSVLRMTKNAPSLERGERAVKISVRIPASSFIDPPGLTAEVTFGADAVMEPSIVVEPAPLPEVES